MTRRSGDDYNWMLSVKNIGKWVIDLSRVLSLMQVHKRERQDFRWHNVPKCMPVSDSKSINCSNLNVSMLVQVLSLYTH